MADMKTLSDGTNTFEVVDAKAVHKDETGKLTENLNLGSNRLINVGDPIEGGDAVNKNYVDKSHKVTTSGTVTRGFILNDPNHNQRVSVKVESPDGDYILIADDARIGLYNKTTSTWVGSISWGGR